MYHSLYWIKSPWLSVLVLTLIVSIFQLPDTASATQQTGSPSIQVTKKQCAGRNVLPVFVESHCNDVPGASFTLVDPGKIEVVTLQSGERYLPDDQNFGGSNLWSLTKFNVETGT